MFKLAHLSDTHLTVPGPRRRQLLNKRLIGYLNWHRGRRHVHLRPVLDLIVADILERAPDHIAVTGDLVNIGLPAEFEQALTWLRTLGAPGDVSVVPGNHDTYVSLPYDVGIGHWRDYMAGDATGIEFRPDLLGFPYVRRRGELAIVGLCSAVPTLPFMAAGRLGAAQLHALPSILRALGERGLFRVVLVHHPPLPRLSSWLRGLHDVRELDAVLARSGVELVLYGHNHVDAVDTIETDGGPAPAVCVPSASVGSPGGKVLAAYNLYEIDRRPGGGWRIDMERRGMATPGGGVERLERRRLNS